MSEAQQGSSVKLEYTGKLEDGTVFDSSEQSGALEFTIGEGKIISGVEEAVRGMTPGEQKTVEVAPEQGYGERQEEMVVDVERNRLPDDLTPEVGQQLQVQREDGQTLPVTVAEVFDEQVRLDANHPLAGQNLTFDLKLLESE